MAFNTNKKPSGKSKGGAKMGATVKNTNSSTRKVSTDIRPQSK
jgi:hypothetical protein